MEVATEEVVVVAAAVDTADVKGSVSRIKTGRQVESSVEHL